MEKSIESIWKNGFLKDDALIAPQVNNLYHKKSVHVMEKFKKMFLKNIWGIIIGAGILFLGAWIIGALLAGSIVLVMMLFVAYSAYKDLQELQKIDNGESSYAYLTSLKNWIDQSIEHYGKMYKAVYPLLILSVYFGLWFSDHFESIRQEVSEHTELFYGMHLDTTLLVLCIAILMSIFSKTIHRRDVKTIYGGILKKLELSIAEMEELKKA